MVWKQHIFFVLTINLGDQGFAQNCHGAIFSRTSETDPKERLSPFIPLPQEFHAEKVGFFMLILMSCQQN